MIDADDDVLDAEVPVLIDAVEPPLGFGESQATSLKGWKGDRADRRYGAVLAAVQRIAGNATAPVAATKPGAVDRRALLAGGAVVTVAVIGAGGWALLKPGSSSKASDSIAVLPFANLSGDPSQWNRPIWQHDLEGGLRMLRLAIDTHLITSHQALPLLVRRFREVYE